MNNILSPDRLNNLFYQIQQAFLYNISFSLLSISFQMEELNRLHIRIYLLENATEQEKAYIEKAKSGIIEKLESEIKLHYEIIEVTNRITVFDLETLKYKFYLKNQDN